MKSVGFWIVALVLFPAVCFATPPGAAFDVAGLDKLERHMAALELGLANQASAQPVVQPNQAVFRQGGLVFRSPNAPLNEVRVVHLSTVKSIKQISTAPVQILGRTHQVRVYGDGFGLTVGLFGSAETSGLYFNALTDWMQEGGAQPIPEDFNGLSVLQATSN